MNLDVKDVLLNFHKIRGKKILLCVSGSISAYKILNLAHFLKKCGAEIRVVMSDSAQKFVTKLSFSALIHSDILDDESEVWGKNSDFFALPNHINYAIWADVALIAPATANTIAKIAFGIADNAFCATVLALPKNTPKILAPAMNTNMLQNPATQRNLLMLRENFEILPPKIGILACETHGEGALCDENDMIFGIFACFCRLDPKITAHKKIIISGGGSAERIDPAREISNNSSGLQASTMALCAHFMGFEVDFISSKFPLALPKNIKQIFVKSAQDFHKDIKNALDPKKQNFLFMAAAIADFTPEHPKNYKIKKENLSNLNINFVKTADILREISGENIVKIGFKAEFDEKIGHENAKKMLVEKNCDFVCLNVLNDASGIGFGGRENEIFLLEKGQNFVKLLKNDKINISFEILRRVFEKFR